MPADTPAPPLELPPGMVAVTTYGTVQAETVQALWDMRAHTASVGITNVHYAIIPGSLVDKARNEAAREMLKNPKFQYLVFLDADMTFAPPLLQQLLTTAYGKTPWADAVGAWCALRGKPYLPTIDTGTGTWETHDSGLGPLEVIRTGSACILVKRHIFERLEYPWYGVRPAPRALDVLAELDNYARTKMDGRNPLREHAAWATLETCARQDAQAQRANPLLQVPGGFLSSVGEDSAFCDKTKAAGFRIVVDTDIVCGHLEHKTILPADHIAAMRESELWTRQAVGLLE